ncbi:TipJ family phage tail tip protein [Hafnia psychrotolerans]|uniref:Host specificity protein J n=1 Tax=Hafnia psychrotolerans TaxID=1477018 RepID=A0ABQ1GTF4_9GAMM|nr:phage tail protein [Hafnia psychrotolerans]GGA49557.1 host specificity protein J [Hafnia psychrotolerans]
MSSGGGGGSTPKLINDNLKSKQFYQVLDLISEGPIYGPVDQDHLSSFLLNKTPVTNANGDVSVNGVSVAWRPGTASQSPINGFGAIQSTTIINTAVTQSTPLVRTITDNDVTRVRFNVGVSSLAEQDSKGNQKNTSVTIVLETRTGNSAFQVAQTVTITGKISGEYLEAYVIDAPETKPFDIRVRRITPDSTSDLLTNGTVWNSFVEITDDNLSYPYSAVCGAVIDRDQYTDTPNRTYHLRGLIVDVPENYDPITRTYSGLWLGGFKSAWTSNPAWIFRALVKNTRYGLARRAGYIDIDDGSLYVLSQFCDQPVDDGYGGKEPRFTLNAYITEQKSARDLLDDIAGMFRGIALWDGMRFSIMIDRPQDPVSAVTNANVVDGLFSYSSMKRSERYNAVVVSWTDPSNGWEQVKEYYSDDALIDRYGYNETTIEAFGCTSRGQALRTAKWLVESAKLEKEKVTFKMARDAIAFMPGDIIEVMDNDHAATRLGGRIISHSGRVLNVDANVSELAGNGDTMSIMGSDGKFVKHVISSVSGSAITLSSAPLWVKDGTIFVISAGEVSTRLWRIMGVSEDENNSVYSISATLHNPNKQAIVDDGAVFDVPNDTLNGYRVPNIENLRINNVNSETVQVAATWETATLTKKIVFELYVYSLDGKVVAQYETDQFRYEFYGLTAGAYSLGVRGRNENGMKGAETQISLVIGAPAAPSFIQWTPGFFSADIVPVMNVSATTDTSFEFWFTGEVPASSVGNVENEAQFLGRATQWTLHALKADTTYYMYVRTKNAFGVSGFVEASGKASSDIPGMIDYIDEAIRKSEAFERLSSNIDTNIEGLLQNALNLDASIDHQFKAVGSNRADILTVKQTVADNDHAYAEKFEQIQAQSDTNTAAVQQVSSAYADLSGKLSAQWGVKVQIDSNGNKYVAGMQLGVEGSGGSVQSYALFSADNFAIYNTNNGSYQLAFAAVNGQTFLRSTFIQDGTIDNAKIGNFIQSNNYDGSTQGWQLSKSGTFINLGNAGGAGAMKQTNTTISAKDDNGVLRVQVGLITGNW